ncbi:autophagy-related protein 27-domain-containing protein [Butyriboletus roseoflavus]|nr:autophagy-related protein 27-domain-containing protein [Butyriboletus roseoflavus]
MPVHRRPAFSLPLRLFSIVFLLSAAFHVTAQDSGSFGCHFSVGELKYDLSELGGPKVLSRTRESPPSTYVDELRFDLCADLTEVEGRASDDQCPSGTRACLTTINQKADSPDRITTVIPIAQSSFLDAETSALSSPEGVTITLHGAPYGPYPPSSIPVPQSLKISLTCAEGTTEPQFSSYANGQVLVEWSSSAACGTTGAPNEDEGSGGGGGGKEEDTPIENVGSGLGFFFLMLILAFAAYFALGAYYNYSTYGARGWDLIPIEAGPKTKNIPGGSIHQSFFSEDEAIRMFEAAKARGEVKAYPDAGKTDKSTGKSKNAPLSPLVAEVALLRTPSNLRGDAESTGMQSPLSASAHLRVFELRRTLRDTTDPCSTSSSPPTGVTQGYVPLYEDDSLLNTPVAQPSPHFTFTSSSSRAYPSVSDGHLLETGAEEMLFQLEVSDWGSPSLAPSSSNSHPGAEEHTSKPPRCMPLHSMPPPRSVGVEYRSLTDFAESPSVDSRIWLPKSRVFDPDNVKPRPLTRPSSPAKRDTSSVASHKTVGSGPQLSCQISLVDSPFVTVGRGRYSRLAPSWSLPTLPDREDNGSGFGSRSTQRLENNRTGKGKEKEINSSVRDKHLAESPTGYGRSPRNDGRSHVQLVPRDSTDEQSAIMVHCPPNCPHETCYFRPLVLSVPTIEPSRHIGSRYVDACVSPIITTTGRIQDRDIRSKQPDLDDDHPYELAGFTHVSPKGTVPEADARSPIVKGTMVPMNAAE